MKKFILSTIASLGFLLIIPAASFADSIVAGTVTSSGNPVPGANVTVTCDSNVITAVTSAAGAYGVDYSPTSLCPAGTKATVTAAKGAASGSSSGTLNQEGDLPLNVAIINVSVPEFGAITGTAALALGGGAFLIIRYRNLSGNKT